MATMRTTLSGYETQGEKQLYYRFRDKLSDDYHVWHNIHLLKARTEVDFIILHPAEGIYVLEVKDWPIEIIINADAHRAYIDKSGRTENLQNPITQARQNSFAIRNNLIRDPRMVHKEGPHKDQLVVPVNYGAVFPNITIQQLLDKGLDAWFPLQYTLDQEFTRGQSYTDQDIEKALSQLRDRKFYPLLGEPQWNAINELLGTPVVTDLVSSELIGVFDNNQEMLVKFKIYKQISIEGPAGSGKSLVLVKRAIYIKEQNPDWNVAIFCFNVVLVNYLRTLLDQEKENHGIVVCNFNLINPSTIDPISLDAVLIDEGQDLTEEYLERVIGVMKNKTVPLTIFFDQRQSIYSNEDLYEMLTKKGIDIANQKELVRQQRSVHIILAVAFFRKFLEKGKETKEIINESLSISERFFWGYKNEVSSVSTGTKRHFSDEKNKIELNALSQEVKNRVILKFETGLMEILDDFLSFIKEMTTSGKANYGDFMIIYPNHRLRKKYIAGGDLKVFLAENKIPFRIIDKKKYGFSANFPDFEIIEEDDNRSSADLTEDVVRISTIHQAKGIDAKYVAIIGFENIVKGDSEEETKAALGYVGLTRAKEKCFIYYRDKNEAVEILDELLESF